jgi:hypothetical protein
LKLVLRRQGKELKAPEEKTVFEEDLSPEEKARILKEKRLGRLVQRDGWPLWAQGMPGDARGRGEERPAVRLEKT